jgi:hypothetical protein
MQILTLFLQNKKVQTSTLPLKKGMENQKVL